MWRVKDYTTVMNEKKNWTVITGKIRQLRRYFTKPFQSKIPVWLKKHILSLHRGQFPPFPAACLSSASSLDGYFGDVKFQRNSQDVHRDGQQKVDCYCWVRVRSSELCCHFKICKQRHSHSCSRSVLFIDTVRLIFQSSHRKRSSLEVEVNYNYSELWHDMTVVVAREVNIK